MTGASPYRLVADIGELFRPPRRIAVRDAAEETVVVSTGGYSGKWDASQTPYMIEPMNLINDRKVTSIIFAGPARTGKTMALLDCGIGYVISCDPSDMLVVHMTEEAARKYSRLRIKRMLNHSPRLAEKMSPHKHDDNIFGKYFRNGAALLLAWPSPTQLSAQDYKYVFLSDYDRMPDDCGEGDVYSLAMKRTQTFMSGGVCVAESSPGRDFTDASWKPTSPHQAPPVGGILGLYNTGDRRLWHWTCPECEGEIPIVPGLGLFNLPEQSELIHEIRKNGAKATAEKYDRIVAPCCGCELDYSNKHKMNATGYWKAENDNANSIASFWLGGVAAKYQTWLSLLEKEFAALYHYATTGEQEKLKGTRNTDQGIPYIPVSASEKMSAQELEARAENLGVRIVPKGVRALFAAVDVQGHKFVCQVQGVGIGRESWIIDRFDIAISEREAHGEQAILDPAGYKEDWDVLFGRVILKRYEMDDAQGRTMGIVMTTCDSGGKEGVTENAYHFWKKAKGLNLHDRFNLVKGERPKPTANKPMISQTTPDKSSGAATKAKVVGELPLWLINTTMLKDAVASNLRRAEPGNDYMHFPDWLEEWFYAEVVAETRTEKGWANLARAKNEAFDLICYAKAGYLIKLDSYWKKDVDWDAPPPWLAEWDCNSEVSCADREPVKPMRRARRTMRVRR